jgi:hypothetical protein
MSQRNPCGHTSKNKPWANQIQICKSKWEKKKKKQNQDPINLESNISQFSFNKVIHSHGSKCQTMFNQERILHQEEPKNKKYRKTKRVSLTT